MTESLISNIKDSVQHYAQAISTVLEMDVDIVDECMVRIAGTGQFCVNIGKHIDNEGNAFKRVLQYRRTLIVENPGSDEVCLECMNKDNCREQFEICCPILLDREVIGVISLAVFEENKKNNIFVKQKNFVSFLEQISGLIAAKASEYRSFREQALSLQLLEKLQNCISEGVIIFDVKREIMHINTKCEQVLGHSLEQLVYLKKIKEFAIFKQNRMRSTDEVEYIARVKSKKIRLVGKIYPIVIEGQETASVFVFRDVTDINRNLLQSQNMQYLTFDHIIGRDEDFLKVKERARKFAYNEANLLIHGETGTGKEIFARAIHNESKRRDKPFITIVCSGTVETVIEKEIFGYGFQPDEDEKLGKAYMVHGGTIYIDEIGDLTLRLQGRLMEIIQNAKDYGIRLIAGTSRNLKEKAENGEFRKDLYYSLKAFEISIPPVRSRPLDIVFLIDYFMAKYCRIEGKEIELSEGVLRLMKKYPWRGNVREMEKTASFIVSTQNDGAIVETEDLPSFILNQLSEAGEGQHNLERIEKDTIIKVLNLYGNSTESKKKAAKELGVGIATLYRKIEKYGIEEKKQYDIYQNDN